MTYFGGSKATVEARVIRTWRSRLYSALGTFYFHSNRRIAIHCNYRCVRALDVEMRFRNGPWSRMAWPRDAA